jgi:hypothetical protein
VGDKNNGGKDTTHTSKGKTVKENLMETQAHRIPADPNAARSTATLKALLEDDKLPESRAQAIAIAASAETLAMAIAGQGEILKAHLDEVRRMYGALADKAELERKILEHQAKKIEDETLPKELLRTAANVGVVVALTGGVALLLQWIWPGNPVQMTAAGGALKK